MSIKVFYNPSCSKCRMSLEILNGKGEELEVVEYLKDSPSFAELKELQSLLGLPARAMLRTGESIFKERYSALNTQDDDAVLRAIEEAPILLERPIVIRGNRAVIGRPPETIEKLWT